MRRRNPGKDRITERVDLKYVIQLHNKMIFRNTRESRSWKAEKLSMLLGSQRFEYKSYQITGAWDILQYMINTPRFPLNPLLGSYLGSKDHIPRLKHTIRLKAKQTHDSRA